jgi:hypothetical protein
MPGNKSRLFALETTLTSKTHAGNPRDGTATSAHPPNLACCAETKRIEVPN